MAPPLIELSLPGLAPLPDDDTVQPTAESPQLLVVLLPDGQARMHHSIVLRTASGRRAAVRVDPLTGHVSVVELQPSEEAPERAERAVPA